MKYKYRIVLQAVGSKRLVYDTNDLDGALVGMDNIRREPGLEFFQLKRLKGKKEG